MNIRTLALFGLVGIACFIATIVALHVLQPELSPLHEAVSYYVHGASGWLTTIGLLALGFGSLFLTMAARSVFTGPGARLGIAGLALWSACVIVGGILPADPPGNWDKPPSTAGAIHGFAALIALASFPAAAVTIARNFRRNARWQHFSRITSMLAVACALSFVLFILSLAPVMVTNGPPLYLGLTERIMLGAYAAWLAWLAIVLMRGQKVASGGNDMI